MYRLIIGAILVVAFAALSYALPVSQGAEQVRRVTEIMTRKAVPQPAETMPASAYAPRVVRATPTETPRTPQAKSAETVSPRITSEVKSYRTEPDVGRIKVAELLPPKPKRLAQPRDAEARAQLVRSLQGELKRIGCYAGPANGRWSKRSRAAMARFIQNVNARLPTAEPDYILLALVQGSGSQRCGRPEPGMQIAGAKPPVPNDHPPKSSASKTPRAELKRVVSARELKPSAFRAIVASAAPVATVVQPGETTSAALIADAAPRISPPELPIRKPAASKIERTAVAALSPTVSLDQREATQAPAARPTPTVAAPVPQKAKPAGQRELVRKIIRIARRTEAVPTRRRAVGQRRAARKIRIRKANRARARRAAERRRRARLRRVARKRTRAAQRRRQFRLARLGARRSYRPRRRYIRRPRFNAETFFAALERRIK